jgi:hypothetical protein
VKVVRSSMLPGLPHPTHNVIFVLSTVSIFSFSVRRNDNSGGFCEVHSIPKQQSKTGTSYKWPFVGRHL